MNLTSGKINIEENTDSIEDILRKLLRITNSSNHIIDKKIERLQSLETRARSTEEDLVYQADDESDYSKDVLTDIKKEYIIKNIMGIISHMGNYPDKVCCIIYLMMEKGMHVEFNSIFRLLKIDTEYEYINKQNEEINNIIEDIIKETFAASSSLEQSIIDFKKNADPEIVNFLQNKYTSLELLSFRTGAFYKALRRHFGDSFTDKQKKLVSTFLSEYKKSKHDLIYKPLEYYLGKFNFPIETYKKRMAHLDAFQEVNKLSGYDLLNIY